MIAVTRLDGTALVLNADLIEAIEAVPETVVTLRSQKKVFVRESVAELVDRVIAYQRAVHAVEATVPEQQGR